MTLHAEAEKLVTDDYVVLPGDLREADVVWDQLKAAGLESSLPTLIIAECVLVYMPPEDSANLINKLGSNLSTAAFLVYEQVNPLQDQITANASQLLFTRALLTLSLWQILLWIICCCWTQ